ncbi:MAG TPA: ATP-dependent 6-phosphofructokinase [Thermoanaerobaculia bacterium]|nr:ATP-dependent 6-phosphofructokinase [Thermoanaerobaculia bacterium]
MPPKRIGILTGGGDAPGLNAVIRSVVRSAERLGGFETWGILDGFEGLLERRFRPLDRISTRGLVRRGGTVLGTSNRCNPFRFRDPDGSERDRSREVLDNAREAGLEGLIVIGGDGSLRIAVELVELGLAIVGVPKTIDNDLAATDYTFGFWTAIGTATDALDRLRDTAESHHRVMLLELMGRDAGWIALCAGIAGAADVILIPEIPYRIEAVEATIEGRAAGGQPYSLVVVAEGAVPVDGKPSYVSEDAGDGHPRHGGAGERLARELMPRIEHEIRTTVLGHLQRGGSPVPFDRILATRMGTAAAELASTGRWGRMVCLRGESICDVPLVEAVARPKLVDPRGDLVASARATGITFGD